MHAIEMAVQSGPADEREAARREAERIEARLSDLATWPVGDTAEARAEVCAIAGELGRLDGVYRPSACGPTAPFINWHRAASVLLAREAARILGDDGVRDLGQLVPHFERLGAGPVFDIGPARRVAAAIRGPERRWWR